MCQVHPKIALFYGMIGEGGTDVIPARGAIKALQEIGVNVGEYCETDKEWADLIRQASPKATEVYQGVEEPEFILVPGRGG